MDVTITNLSGSTGTLTGNVGALSAPFSFVSGSGAFSLSPGRSQSIVGRFSPVALGQSSGTLSITHNAANQDSPINVPLSGQRGYPGPCRHHRHSRIRSLWDYHHRPDIRPDDLHHQSGRFNRNTHRECGSPLPLPSQLFQAEEVSVGPPGQSKSVALRFLPTVSGHGFPGTSQ